MRDPVYPDAPESLIALWEGRRKRLAFGPGEELPGLDIDMGALALARVPASLPPLAPDAGQHARKVREIAPEFAGLPALFLLHGVTIAHLRKRRWPRHAPALFRKMWEDQADCLLRLPARWLISAAITFGEHGKTESERTLGREFNILFSLMKLYEFERLRSGTAPEEPFPAGRRHPGPLPMGMEPFSLASGGLDINLLAPLWQRAADEPVLGPLALMLMERLNLDHGTIFGRLQKMRALKGARTAQP
jgi:hypothetical protein